MKRRIFTYLGALFLMSHIIVNNVAAFDVSVNIMPVKRLVGPTNVYFRDSNSNTLHSGFYAYGKNESFDGSRSFTITNSSANWGSTASHYYVISGQFYSNSDYAGTINSSGTMGIGNTTTNCPILELETSDSVADNIDNSALVSYRQSFTIVCYENSTQIVGPTINLQLYLANTTTIEPYGIVFTSVFDFAKDNSISDIHTDLNNIYNWLQNNSDSAGDVLNQEKQDVQDASDDSETTAEANSENQATTTLSNNLNNIFSTISSTQASNCIIAGNLGHINMGNINLCQGKENFNQLFEFIGYTSLFTVCFWAAYHLISRTIKLIDWARS